MAAYVIRRLFISIPTVFLVVTAVFFAFQVIPGDAARMYAGEQASVAAVEAIRVELGLDQPVSVQYLSYLKRLGSGDLGISFITRRPVTVEIGTRFANTAILAFGAIILSTALGIFMGVMAALNRGKWLDYFLSVLAVGGISIPVFWLGLLLMFLFSLKLHWLPTAGNATWQHYIMPTFCLSVYSVAFITRMARSTVLDVLGSDYVRTAQSKGLREKIINMRHVVRNALIPLITTIGLRFGYMLGGAVVTETVFAWPGVGRLLVIAVTQRDIPVVQGILLVFASVFLLVNIIVDVLYSVADPRLSY